MITLLASHHKAGEAKIKVDGSYLIVVTQAQVDISGRL